MVEWATANRLNNEYLKIFNELPNHKFHAMPASPLDMDKGEKSKTWMVVYKQCSYEASLTIQLVLTKRQAENMAEDLNKVLENRGQKSLFSSLKKPNKL